MGCFIYPITIKQKREDAVRNLINPTLLTSYAASRSAMELKSFKTAAGEKLDSELNNEIRKLCAKEELIMFLKREENIKISW